MDKDITNFLMFGYMTGNLRNKVEYFLDLDFPDKDRFDTVDGFNLKGEDITEIIYDSEFLNEMRKVANHFEKEYMDVLFSNRYNRIRLGAWNMCKPEVDCFHNDSQKDDRFNASVLIYLDKNHNEYGNFIETRNPQGDKFKLIPKCGDFIFLNQKIGFDHRGAHFSGQRRMIILEYDVHFLR